MLHLPRNMHEARDSAMRRAASRIARFSRPAALLLLAFGALFAAETGEPHHVKAIRFWSLGAVTRIAIETDGDFQLRSDHLTNPDRLFFDLVGARPALSRKSLTVIPVSDSLLRQIRVAEPQNNITRVVLDLMTPVQAITSRLDNPSRLIIELRARGASPQTTKSPAVPLPEDEPQPATKPTERKPFAPPPAAPPQPVRVIQAQTTTLDAPPQLLSKNTPPAVPSGLSVNDTAADKVALVQAQPSAVAVLAKPTPTGIASTSSSPSAPVSAVFPSSPADTALPAKRNSAGDRSMIRVLGLKIDRIVLDPGHGGHDTGTIGPSGLREKDLVLDVAQRLGKLIEQRMGSEVIFTRSDDTFIPLERRTEIANEAKADLFLSIHANSSPYRAAAGVETYYLNFTTSKGALDLASRENSGSQMSVYELQGLLEKIALKDKVEESREFAVHLQNSLYSLSAKSTDARSKDRGVKKAPFIVLIGASMPSVLAEIGFISNAHDESVMRREDYRERTAEALYKGISSYATSLSHFQVAQRH